MIIAANLKDIIPIILEVIRNNLLQIKKDHEFFTHIHNKMDNFHFCMDRWFEPYDN